MESPFMIIQIERIFKILVADVAHGPLVWFQVLYPYMSLGIVLPWNLLLN
jgi:hypothetical protein